MYGYYIFKTFLQSRKLIKQLDANGLLKKKEKNTKRIEKSKNRS